MEKQVSSIVFDLIVILFGLSKLRFSEKTSDKINFGIIHGNVDQNLKWNHTNESLILDKYFKLASETKSNYIFLPETSFPLLRNRISKSYLDKYFNNKHLKFLFLEHQSMSMVIFTILFSLKVR